MPKTVNRPFMDPSEINSTIYQEEVVLSDGLEVYDYEGDIEQHIAADSKAINNNETMAKQFKAMDATLVRTFDQRGTAAAN
jgi:hypothetical protein